MELDTKSISILNKPPKTVIFRCLLTINHEDKNPYFALKPLPDKRWSRKFLDLNPYDKFDEGWAQCLAEMVAAQKLNNQLKLTIFGIVSNGKGWEFGKLEDRTFMHHPGLYTIQEIDRLFALVNYVFQQCEIQLNELVAA